MSASIVIETDLGNIAVDLDPGRAPKTVENFLRYVDSGHYENTIFHRVIPGFMVQGGGYDPTCERRATEAPVPNEADNGLRNERGTIAMARTSEPHSATAQFFINVANNTSLDHTDKSAHGWGYTVFGRVTSGMDVVDRIVAVPTGPAGPFTKDAPRTPIVIRSVRRA